MFLAVGSTSCTRSSLRRSGAGSEASRRRRGKAAGGPYSPHVRQCRTSASARTEIRGRRIRRTCDEPVRRSSSVTVSRDRCRCPRAFADRRSRRPGNEHRDRLAQHRPLRLDSADAHRALRAVHIVVCESVPTSVSGKASRSRSPRGRDARGLPDDYCRLAHTLRLGML